jgi:hypothetical protein
MWREDSRKPFLPLFHMLNPPSLPPTHPPQVMMFMHIAPEGNFLGETVSTLQFGTKVSSVTLGQVRERAEEKAEKL